LQKRLARDRIAGRGDDTLLLLQHPPVFTIGRSGGIDNVAVTRETLLQEEIEVFYVKRGGDITYHGPGQLVAYPILDLRSNGLDVHQYVWNLEEVIIRALSDLDISSQRVSGLPNYRGVWAGTEKVCAIGIHITRGVTMHGLALNVNPNLQHYSYINPCGMTDVVVTSISKLLGHEVTMEDVKEKVLQRFSQVFNLKLERGERPADV
jgi:lipoate-protein ligase B